MPETEMEFLSLPHLLLFSAEPQVPQTSVDVEVGPIAVSYACCRVAYTTVRLLVSWQPLGRGGARRR